MTSANECPTPANFRDVGDMLSVCLDPSPLPAGPLYRGGKLDPFMGPALAVPVGTIINLRSGADAPLVGVRMVHLPAPNGLDRYDTHLRPARVWVRSVVAQLFDPPMPWPVYIHCASGRDRTGAIRGRRAARDRCRPRDRGTRVPAVRRDERRRHPTRHSRAARVRGLAIEAARRAPAACRRLRTVGMVSGPRRPRLD